MKETLPEMLKRVGVDYVLGPYQTQPWSHMDVDEGVTCSGEVRMSPDGEEFEAELQIMYDVPPEGKRPMEQLMWLRSAVHKDEKWEITNLKIKGENETNSIYGWEEKGCTLFRVCAKKLANGEIPDFDAICKDHFKEDESFAGRRGSGGSKSPRIRPEKLLNPQKGGGGF